MTKESNQRQLINQSARDGEQESIFFMLWFRYIIVNNSLFIQAITLKMLPVTEGWQQDIKY